MNKRWELTLTSRVRGDDGAEIVHSVPLQSMLVSFVTRDDHDIKLTEVEFDELVKRLKDGYYSRSREIMNY